MTDTAVGCVVSRGTIRVDARKAVSKLREHQLLDLHHYACEIVRAAAAMGSADVQVDYDADDVTLQWAAPPPEATELVGLLDWILVEDHSGERRGLRLLALAVNAALGLAPALVDVIVASDGSAPRCQRLRFRPEILEQSDTSPGRLAPEWIDRPASMPSVGMRVRVRRRFGWNVLRRAATGGAPREVMLLQEAAGDVELGLRIQGVPVVERTPQPLIRVPMAVAGARRAWLELVDPVRARPHLDFLEQGIRLASVPLSLEPDWPAEPQLGLQLPVRVVVDALELPTNASRSAVREDAPVFLQAMQSARAAFSTAVRALLAALRLEPMPEERMAMGPATAPQLQELLGALVCVAVAATHHGTAVGPLAKRLLRLPVLRDACGRPCAYQSLLDQRSGPIITHHGSQPVDAGLGFWMSRVVWARGGAGVEGALALFEQTDAAPVVRRAEQAAERRQRLLGHPAGNVTVPPSPTHLARETFHVSDGPFAGLRGEVAVLGGPRARAGMTVRVFMEGRPFATETLAPDVVPLGLDVALSWEQALAVRFDFDGIVVDEPFKRAAWYAAQLGTMLVRRLAEQLAALAPAARDALRPLLRAATGTSLLASTQLGLSELEAGALAATDPLFTTPCWPTTEPGRFESLALLARYAKRTGALCVAAPRVRGAAPDGRPVVAIDRAERTWLVAALGRSVRLIRYDDAVRAPERWAQRDETRPLALRTALAKALDVDRGPLPVTLAPPCLPFSLPNAAGLVAVADQSRYVLLHSGRTLGSKPHARRYGPVVFVVDDDTIVPAESWEEALWNGSLIPCARLERELLATLVAALEGDPGAREQLRELPPLGAPADPRLATYLLESTVRVRAQAELARRSAERTDTSGAEGAAGTSRIRAARQAERDALLDLQDRLGSLPFLPVLDAAGQPTPLSLNALNAIHSGAIPYLTELPGFPTLDWRPLLLESRALLDVLGRWRPRGAEPVLPHDLQLRRLLAERHGAIGRLLAQPRLDPADLGSLADPRDAVHWLTVDREPLSVLLDSLAEAESPFPWVQEDGVLSAAVALSPRNDVDAPQAELEVLFRRRALHRLRLEAIGLPIVGRVNLVELEDVTTAEPVGAFGATAVRELVAGAALGLTLSLLEGGEPGERVVPFDDRRLTCLVAKLLPLLESLERPDDVQQLTAAVREPCVGWPTVQGASVPWSALLHPDGTVLTSTRRFVPWHPGAARRSALDGPVLLVPEGTAGALLFQVVERLGATVQDVSEALARLQSRRARQAPEQSPRLAGPPSHPRLRTSLAAIGVTVATGELELVAGSSSEISLVELEGTGGRVLPANLPVPLRVVARLDGGATARVVETFLDELRVASGRMLRELYAILDELPTFVRERARQQLGWHLMEVNGDTAVLDPADLAAPLFCDVRGGAWSLDAVRAGCGDERGDGVWFTSAAPPFPERDYGRVVLCLPDPALVETLRPIAALRNMTRVLGADLVGEQRARAPEHAQIVLGPEPRARCVAVVALRGPGVEGEVGIVASAAPSRGIEVSTGRRPLCTIDDGPGWPLVAVVNDDRLRPSRRFDGIAFSAQRTELREAVRAAAQAHLRQWLSPPADAIATQWVDSCAGDEEPASADRPRVVGALWLASSWPVDPAVRIRTLARPDGDLLALRASLGCPLLDARLPVGGELLVVAAVGGDRDIHSVLARPVDEHHRDLSAVGGDRDTHCLLVEEATAAARQMLEQVAMRTDGARTELERFRWDLELSAGAAASGSDAPLSAATTSGRRVGPTEVRAELARRGELWFSEQRGTSLGSFPDGEPGFVLDGNDPLVDVLRQRAHPGVVRELGGLEERAPSMARAGRGTGEAAGPSGDADGLSPVAAQAVALPGAEATVLDAAPSPADASATSSSRRWLGALSRRIAVAFGRGDEQVDGRASLPAGLSDAIGAEIVRLGLQGDPVVAVVHGRARHGVRYDPKTRRVVLDPSHPAVSILARASAPASAVTLLVAAAVGEINRELGTVTDQEELRVLSDLLAAHEDSA